MEKKTFINWFVILWYLEIKEARSNDTWYNAEVNWNEYYVITKIDKTRVNIFVFIIWRLPFFLLLSITYYSDQPFALFGWT